MNLLNKKDYKLYSNFLNTLAKDLNKFYYSKLSKTFAISNKLKGKGYDPVTSSDKAFEKFIRLKIKKKFPSHQVIGEEFGHKKSTSDYTWVIDPIDGTRSFVIGNPTWSNLISLNFKGMPVVGLANFPILNKKDYKLYSNFLNALAKDLNKFYYSKLNKTFAISNKLKGKGYDLSLIHI